VTFNHECVFYANVHDNDFTTAGTSGVASTGPIRFGIGRYTLQRAQRKRERGEESPWRTPRASPERRAELVEALREQITRRRSTREGSAQFSPHEARTLWRRADHRPALYRHILLLQLRTDSGNLGPPPLGL
jgi:hypothetical protein